MSSSHANSTISGQPEVLGVVDVIPDLDQGFVSGYASHVDAKRLAVAFLALAVYDFVITIGDSVNLFWMAPRSAAKVMYIISRYSALYTVITIVLLITMPSPPGSFCGALTWLELLGTIVIFTMISLAMITRAYALWNRDKRILIGTLSVFLIHITVYIVVTCYAYGTGTMLPSSPPFTGCFLILGYDKLWVTFIPNITFETLIVILTVYKTWSITIQSGIRTPLFTMLLSDGLLYYWIIMASQVLSFICMMVPSSLTVPIIGAYPSITITGIACNRLFTRLQRLLLSKSKGQSSFTTHGFGTSIVPDFPYDDGAKGPNSTTGDIGLRTMSSGAAKDCQSNPSLEVNARSIPCTTLPLNGHRDPSPYIARQIPGVLEDGPIEAPGLMGSTKDETVPTAHTQKLEETLGAATGTETDIVVGENRSELPT